MTMALLMAVVSSNVIEDLNCKAQTVAAEAQLQNTVFVEGLIKCLKSDNPRQECDKDGLKARRIAPMVLRGICPPPCNKCIARLMRMSIAKMQNEHPAEMKEIMDKIMG